MNVTVTVESGHVGAFVPMPGRRYQITWIHTYEPEISKTCHEAHEWIDEVLRDKCVDSDVQNVLSRIKDDIRFIAGDYPVIENSD